MQREIDEGLNLIESWNRVNGVIFFGKSGEFATNRRDQQELGVLALHILQAALVHVNTLMIQDILAEPEWAGVLTPEDLRGLTLLGVDAGGLAHAGVAEVAGVHEVRGVAVLVPTGVGEVSRRARATARR